MTNTSEPIENQPVILLLGTRRKKEMPRINIRPLIPRMTRKIGNNIFSVNTDK
jgi:hypothetical protein